MAANDEDPLSLADLAEAESIDEQIDQQRPERSSSAARQRPRSDAWFIGELHDFYTSQSEAFDARLDQVRNRLEQHGAIPRRSGQPSRARQAHPSASPLPQRSMQRRQDGRQGWSARLAALVAAALLVVLVGGLTIGLTLVHHPKDGTARTPVSQRTPTSSPPSPTTTPTSPPAPAGAFPLTEIQMVDATTGWAEAPVVKSWRIVRTTDGGIHWKDVSPPALPALDMELPAFFLNGSVAWVAALQNNDAALNFFRTTNGGQTWQRGGTVPIQTTRLTQMSFINALNGWFLTDASGGTGATSEPVEVFRTTDGGMTWVKTSDSVPTQASPHPLPVDGAKSGLSFLDASTGWATGGSANNTTDIWLYVTHDGGSNWQAQPLALPSGVTSAQFFWSEPPTFVSAHDGLLTVVFATEKGIDLAVYVTHDGGASWYSTPPVTIGNTVAQDVRTSFTSATQGWAADDAALFVTSDGGQHWSQLPGNPYFGTIESLNFVSNTTGWLLSQTTSGSLVLLKTVDGGQTWTVMAPTLA